MILLGSDAALLAKMDHLNRFKEILVFGSESQIGELPCSAAGVKLF